ncbi:MAG: ABC transporter permease subunit [Bacillota bacterium]
MRIRAIIRKEWEEALRNKLLLYTSFTPPLAFVAIMVVALRQMMRAGPDQVPPQALAMVSAQFTLFLLIIPVILPTVMASYSIIGEKTSRSLEPLLATPVTVGEIMLGKGLAATIPAVLETWVAYLLTVALTRLLVGPAVAALLVSPGFYLPVLLVAPPMAGLGVLLIMIVSSRVNDPRAAQQIGALVILPLFGLFLAQMFGRLSMSPPVVGALFLGLMIANYLLLKVAVPLFQRETILTRWK